MPQSPTPKLGLYRTLADGSEDYDVVLDLLNNWDKVDAAMGATAVTSSTRPASAYNGQMIRETDTGRIYVSNGTLPGSASFGTQPFVVGVRAIGASANVAMLKVGQSADTQDRFMVDSDSELWWGSGSATVDTNLYRSGANTLKTDDSLIVNGDLTVLGIGQSVYLERTSDTATASDATVNADAFFTFSMAASATYVVEIYAIVNGTAGDFKCSWTVPASATGSRQCIGPELASTSRDATLVRASAHAHSTEVTFGVNSANAIAIQDRGQVRTVGAGTWTWNWSQNTSNAAATTVETNSYCIIRRVA
jgi:hypothetical protein